MAPPTQQQQPPADQQLDAFIFRSSRFTSEHVPRGLDPDEVADFIQARIDESVKLVPIEQVEKVVAYYDLYESCPHLLQQVTGRELNDEEARRSTVIARAVARAGQPDDVERVRDCFGRLPDRAISVPTFKDLTLLHVAIGPGNDAKPLLEAIDRQLKSLEEHGVVDSRTGYESEELKELRDIRLPRADKAIAVKERVLKMARSRRIDEEVKMYIGLQLEFPEYLQSWPASRLRREVWGESPEQQIQRKDDSTRRDELVQAFRGALDKTDRMSHLVAAERNGVKVRCLRAIDFFGGQLTEEEQEFVRGNGGAQFDLLSKE